MGNTNREKREHVEKVIRQMLASNPAGCTVQDFVTGAASSYATVRRALAPMLDSGEVRNYLDPHGSRRRRWQLATNVAPLTRRRPREK